MDEDSSKNSYNFIDYDLVDNLCNSIIKILIMTKTNKIEIGTGFFIKLPVNGKETPFLCTASHTLNDQEEITLILNYKGEIKPLKLYLNREDRIIYFKDEIKKAKYDTKVIQILDEEIHNFTNINFLEYETSYIENPTIFNNYPAITAGFPEKILENVEDKDIPLISHGRIIKIKEDIRFKEEIKVVYNMETAKGSSGSPICIINNNKLKLLAIHNSTDEYERSTYNEGVLFGPILKEINSENKQAIPINVRTDYNDVLNVIKNISDIFESLLKREKEKRNDFSKNKQTEIFQYKFLKIKDYEEIKIYHRQILEEFKNRNKERFNAYFNRLNNHILT